MKISRSHLRLLILEEINKSRPPGRVFFGWKDALPGIGDRHPIKHAFIRLERYGPLPEWWPFQKHIVSLSGFSENWDKLDLTVNPFKGDYAVDISSLDDILMYQWGRLVKAVNWGQDMKGKESGDVELTIPGGMSIDDIQKRIIKAYNAYGENIPYSPLPGKANDKSTRNSNSFAFSLLRAGFLESWRQAITSAGVNIKAFAGFNKLV